MTEIVIQVRSEQDGPSAREQLESAFDWSFAPLFPGVTDPKMQSLLQLTLPQDIDPEEVVSDLSRHPAVESAYVKPPQSMP